MQHTSPLFRIMLTVLILIVSMYLKAEEKKNVDPADLDLQWFYKQEAQSGPESLTCTMCTSRISLCDLQGGLFLAPRV